MILLKTNQLNKIVCTVSQNAELATPEWLFSFTHKMSKERVTFILPNLSTHQIRYDQFEFTEGQGVGEIAFPYEGQYIYGIYEQFSGSTNLDPALAYNKVESGLALLVAGSAMTTNDYYIEYLSPDEDNSNIIFAPGELNPPSPTPSITASPTQTPSQTPTNTATPTQTPSLTPTNTNTPTNTPSSNPVCPEQVEISNLALSGFNGIYNRIYTYTGGTFNGGYWQAPTVAGPGIFNTGIMSETGFEYAVYEKVSGSTYYTLVMRDLTATTPSNSYSWGLISTSGTSLVNGGTRINSQRINNENDSGFNVNGIYYPRSGSITAAYVSYPSVCPTSTPTPSVTQTPTKTNTPTPTQTKTPTATPTNTPSNTASNTPTPTQTKTPTQTQTPTKTNTPTPSNTASNTPTPTQTKTPTRTPTPSVTTTATNTPTPSNTASNTPTPTQTKTPTQTPTPSITASSTHTPTPSITASNTPTPTQTQTPTQSETPTNTPLVSPTPTNTQTLTQTPSGTPTQTPTQTFTPTPSSTPFTSEYVSILSRAAELGFEVPSNSEQRRQNQLIADLKNDGVWGKLGSLYVFAQNVVTVGTPSFTFINWITPSASIAQLQRTSSGFTFPSFVNYSGWSFNGNNRMLIPQPTGTAVNPITSLSGGSEGVWVMSAGTSSSSGSNSLFSTDNNEWNRLQSNNTTSQLLFRGNGTTANVDLTGTGFRAGSLSGAVTAVTAVEFYSGTTKLSRTKTATDLGVAGGSFFINGVGTKNWTWTCGMFFSGIALTEQEMNDLNNVFETYLNTST